MGVRQIVTDLIANDKASKPIEKVGHEAERAADKLDHLSAAEQRLALEVEKAHVRVEKATKAAANAEERYGRESVQAREATIRLKSAALDLADAEEKVKHKAEAAGDALDRVKRKAHEAGDAEDQLKRKTREAGNELEETDRKAGGLQGRLGLLGNIARHASGLSTLTLGARGLGMALTQVLPVAARVGAWVGAFGSAALTAAPIVGAFAVKVGAAAAEFGHFAAAAAPAAASLPGLAAGFLFAKTTIGLAAPGIVKGLKPITDAFMGTPGKVNGKKGLIGGLQAQLQDLAGRGLPQLSRQFLKVNFPTIGQAMTRIAVATNGVILAFGRWTTTIAGQRAIRTVVNGTASAVEALAPHVVKLAISLGNLITRAGTGAFQGLSGGLGKAADAAGRFIDRISSKDIQAAWAKLDGLGGAIGGVGGKLRQFGSVIMGGVRWWRANADAIQHVRDVMALVAIGFGVATGGWIPALIAGVSLLIAHWDLVTRVLGRVRTWFHGTSDSAAGVREVLGGLRQGVADLVSWFRGQLLPALERGARAVMPAVHDAIHMVTQAFHDNRDVIGKVQAVLKVLGLIITEAVIPAVTFLAQQGIAYLGAEFTGMIWVINRVVLPGIRIFAHLLLDTLGAIVNGAADAFGWVPGLGPKLHEAANKFNKFRDQVNGALDGVKDQTVTIGVKVAPAAQVKSQLAAFGHAAGGFIRGPGGPRDDAILAGLSNGEFVVNAAATSRHRGLLEAINARGYAHGGLVMSESLSGVGSAQAAEMGLARKLAAQMPTYSGGPVGAGVRQWAGLVAQVLAELGLPSTALGAVLSRMQRESGGNPHAINLTDSNARAGDPSRGLMQTIGSTFNAFAGPFRGRGIWDPEANIYAGLNYARHRYGSGWISRMLAPGGYDQGGWLQPGVHLVENRTGRPEAVLNPRQWDTLRAVVRQGGHSHSSSSTVNVTVEVTASAAAIQDRIEEAVRRGVARGRFSTAVLPAGTR